MSIEAMKQALDALRWSSEYRTGCATHVEAAEGLQDAIEQAEQAQPVAVAVISRIPGGIKIELGGEDLLLDLPDGEHKLYTAPPSRHTDDTALLKQALEALRRHRCRV